MGGIIQEEVSLTEAVQLGAVDGLFFSHYFFPNTCRMESAEFHRDMWRLIDRRSRYKAMMAYRDSAKTTIARLALARRISYLLTRTALYVGASAPHAARSVNWLKKQVEYNTRWAEAFQLRKGDKWSEEHIEIYHGVEDKFVTLLGLGVTGSPRGINIDDWRPDFICCDDIIDEENANTLELRNKAEKKVDGAIKNTLAPETENPDACFLLLNTPIDADDYISKAVRDPMFDSLVISNIDDLGKSTWEARWPTAFIQREKASADARGTLTTYLREKECKVISPDTAAFKESRLQYYDLEPDFMLVALGVDPVPPPTDRQILQGLAKKDFEVISAVGLDVVKNKYYVLAYEFSRGHDPEWTKAKFFELALKYKPYVYGYDAVAYQRTLEYLLSQEMGRRRHYLTAYPIDDKKKKITRITQEISAVSSNGALYIKPHMVEFKEQYIAYPNVAHEDIIESVTLAIVALNATASGMGDMPGLPKEEDIYPPLQYKYGAP